MKRRALFILAVCCGGMGVLSTALFFGSIFYAVAWRGEPDRLGHQPFAFVMDGRVHAGHGAVSSFPYERGIAGGSRPIRRMEWGVRRVKMPAMNAIAIPLWLPALTGLLIGGSVWGMLRRERKRQRERLRLNHCLACGYDLNKIDVRTCPECGVTTPLEPAPT